MKLKNTLQIQHSNSHCLALFCVIFVLILYGSAGTKLSNQTDQLALLEFKHQISNDPHDFLKSWNDSRHFCQWRGVECGLQHQRVVGLNLSGQNILGTISPHIGNLSFLRHIYLHNNLFHGIIPQQIGGLSRLKNLMLSNNTLHGPIPVNLSRCLHLRRLFLENNRLMGRIPVELSFLKNLDTLVLNSNNFTGFIPRSFGNLSSLTQISLSYNNIEGTIPNELGQLTNLTLFSVSVNNLSGMIPSSFYNISTILSFALADNQLTGNLPPNIGITLPNLRGLYYGRNKFHGEIPLSFANASHLQILDLSDNRFTGQVPVNFGFLKNLEQFNAWGNLLGSNATNDLSFITSLSNCSNLQSLYFHKNNFGGEIPRSVGNLSVQFQYLVLKRNYITGTIPSVLENLVNLYRLGLDNNLLSGSIPSSLSKLVNLQFLSLSGNKLNGRIPSSLGNITGLYALNLSDNKFEGNIPESIGNCKRLGILDLSQNRLIGSIPEKVFSIFSLSISLDLSRNSLTGLLPVQVGKLKNLNRLDVSNNKLTGNIPHTIGECSNLEYLYIRGNFFEGIIPPALASLKGIRSLDLSRNNLYGEIPKGMEKLPYLQYLNLSFNKLEGEVSETGVFRNASGISVQGNSKLCGGIKELQLPSCRTVTRKPRIDQAWKAVIIACGVVLVLVLVISIIFLRRKARKGPASSDLKVENLMRISYYDLCRATEGFSPRNLIGSGSFGSVYQGKLNKKEESLVAVKVLNLEKKGASKSFIAECRALRNIRHRNLVKIFTYCSSIDSKLNQFKALVYEFMENGNLDMWLHPQGQVCPRSLSLIQRLNIAIDVANAVHYLHDLCEPAIIHCDLKPSNILLDCNLTAHVGDFGLARLVSKSADTFAQAQWSSMGIKGSLGYAAPEYGMGGEISEYGDVYSYGVLLLEMLTGRRPTDDMFKDDLTLRKYVRMALVQGDIMKIVDTILVETSETETGAASVEDNEYDDEIVVEQYNENLEVFLSGTDKFRKCITGVVEIGVKCSEESPKERMSMNDVVRELYHIRTAFLGDRIIETNRMVCTK